MHSRVYLQGKFFISKVDFFTVGRQKGRFESPAACLLARIVRSAVARIYVYSKRENKLTNILDCCCPTDNFKFASKFSVVFGCGFGAALGGGV